MSAQGKKETDSGFLPMTSSPSAHRPGGIRWRPAVRSFLAQHDFAGKTVVPFMINGGSRMETKQSEVDRWIDVVKALAA